MTAICRTIAPKAATAWAWLLVLPLLAACGSMPGNLMTTPEPVYLRATGSTTLGPLLSELALAYNNQVPTTSLEVTAAGSQFGLDALSSGEADLAFVSWLPPGPDGPQLDPRCQATLIGRDAIAIIVHPSNPVQGLGLLQLQQLFGGKAYEWQAVGVNLAPGQVQPVSREAGSGTRAAFEALAMQDGRVSPRAIVATSSREAVDYVAVHPGAIGYVSADFVSSQVKAVSIEGEMPTLQAVSRGSYLLARDLWLVTASPPPAAVRRFIEFVQGPAGQEIVNQRFVGTR